MAVSFTKAMEVRHGVLTGLPQVREFSALFSPNPT
jgi:hypothetical protein